jgi:GAF domain-containing protein
MVEQVAAALARIASELGPALAPPGHLELLTSITTTARRLFDAGACSILTLSEDESELIFAAASGGADIELLDQRMPAGEGIAGWVALTGLPLAVQLVESDPRWASGFAATTGYRPRSILAVPMETSRGVIGVLEVLDASPTAGQDMELLALFATQAALAIEGARAFGELGRALFTAAGNASHTEDLSAALDQVAADSPAPSAGLADLAAAFAELGQVGPTERAAATRLVREFLAYVRGRPLP